MGQFKIEVSERKIKAGRAAKLPVAASPSDLQNCNNMHADGFAKADRNPAARDTQELSPLSDV